MQDELHQHLSTDKEYCGGMARWLEEDKPMIELQQMRMGSADLSDLSPVLLASDAAAVRVRRTLDRLLNAEQATAETAEQD